MKKNLAVLVIGILYTFLSVSAAFALTPEESLKKNFPAIRVDSIAPSNIPGLYEVTSGRQIFYYAPGAESIVGGPIVTKEGRNLTDEKFQILEQQRLSAIIGKMKDMPLDRALKIGSGKNTVIEITDPDCTFCRRAAHFFHGRTDVTRYIFFYPLPAHKDAEQKIRYILCAKDRGKAYEDVMAGRMDDMTFRVCNEGPVESLAKVHKETAVSLGVTGTPLFFINNQPVIGANLPLIERLLAGGK